MAQACLRFHTASQVSLGNDNNNMLPLAVLLCC